MKKEQALAIQGAVTAVAAYLSDKLGILFPLFCLLAAAMVIDYLTGMLASKREAIDHPGDTAYGWSSKKGAKGIIKKFGYICVIAMTMILDYVVMIMATQMGFDMPTNAIFALLVTVWYLLNESLSIVENAGRMGANVPDWLKNYIAVLKDKIDHNEIAQEPKE